MKYFHILFIAACAAFLSSCSLEERYHFHEDLSGNYEMKLDMSALISLTEGLEDDSIMGEMPGEEMFDELKNIAEKATGISGFSSSYKDGIAKMSFNFSNLSAIDNLSFEGEDQMFFGNDKLKMKEGRNKLCFDLTPSDSIRTAMDELGDDEDLDMGGMGGSMFSFKTILSFDKPIKKVKSKSATHNVGDNSIEYSYSIEDLSDEKKKWKTKIVFE